MSTNPQERGVFVSRFNRSREARARMLEAAHGGPSPNNFGVHSIDQVLSDSVQTTMTCTEVVNLLTKHDCANLSSLLDTSSSSQYPIANGGLGDVFLGKLNDGTSVAIKTIRAYGNSNNFVGTYQKRAAKEIYTWSKCEHPNVVALLGLAVFRNSLAMVSRWEANGNLLTYLLRHPDADRCSLSYSICAGLLYLHQNSIVHGDLKGANVLIAHDGTPMLMDFGNASLLEATLQFTATTSGTNYSLRWTAPEIIKGKSVHTTAGDVYSLGMTILETFTSEIPFPKKNDIALIRHIVDQKKTPARPKGVIPERSKCGNILWAILTSCWSYDPDLRPGAETVFNLMRSMAMDHLQAVEEKAPERDESEDE